MDIRNNGNSNSTPAQRAELAAQRGQKAYEKGAKEGVGGYAIDWWDGVAKECNDDAKSGKKLWIVGKAEWAGASVMGFLAKMSGVAEIEGRWAQNKQLYSDKDATTGEKVKAGAWLGFEGAMAALNFVGVGGIAKGVGRRFAAEAVAKEGAQIMARFGVEETASAGAKVIRGMLPATEEAAGLVRKELTDVVAKLPRTGAWGAAELAAFQKNLAQVGEKYGVKVIFKTGAPQVLTEPGKIVISGAQAAGWHETLHIMQTVQTQATAMASMAERLGKPVAELTAKEAKAAYTATARTLETQAYKHFEEHAFQAVGSWGAKLNPARYLRAAEEGLQGFEKALVTGTAPDLAPNLAARTYGNLTKLGESQGEIAMNFGPIWATVTTALRPTVGPMWQMMKDLWPASSKG